MTNTTLRNVVSILVLSVSATALADAPRVAWKYAAYDVDTLLGEARAGEILELDLLGESYAVELEPTKVRAPGFKIERVTYSGLRVVKATASNGFKGTVDGDSTRGARLSFTAKGISGYLDSEDGRIFIEPYTRGLKSRASLVYHKVYTEKDVDPGYRAGCLHAATHVDPDSEHTEPDAEPIDSAAGLDVIEVFVEADYELYRRHGAGTVEYIETIFNSVSGLYESELGVSLALSGVRVWETSNDPFRQTNATTLLAELREYWRANESDTGRDTVHLLTGRDLDGFTVGYAGVGVICSERWGYGLTEDLESVGWTSLIAAHELGHNLGADHDPSSSSYIMSSSLGSSTLREFSPVSRSVIRDFLADADCVETRDGTDEPPVAPPAPPPPPPGLGLFVRGDFNGDYSVDIGDAIAALNYLYSGGQPPNCFDAADSDDNGRVDMSDAFRVINHSLLGGVAPMAPYPEPGTDPTADALAACAR